MADNSLTRGLNSEPPIISPQPQTVQGKTLGRFATFLLGFYLVLLALILCFLVLKLCPGLTQSNSDDVKIGFLTIPCEMSLILIVMVSGALGSYIHAVTSFLYYTGNRILTADWCWWYILRTMIGITLALVFYFVIRGGFLSSTTEDASINPYGVAASACLVGLCSKQATAKLVDVFDTLFNIKNKPEDSPAPDSKENTAV